MLSKKVIYSIIYSTITLFLLGCNAQEKKDVYGKFPLGTSLTIDILKNSEQIVPYQSELILVYNISDQWDYYDPHLLFFNDSLQLYAAHYFPSQKIEFLDDQIIVGYLNEDRNRRKKQYRNDLPKKYRLNLLSSNHLNGSMRESNKIIQEVKLNTNNNLVKLYLRKSEKKYIGVGYTSSYSDTAFSKNFTLQDTLEYPIAELCFDKANKAILTSRVSQNNRLIWDYMLISKATILEDFYNELFNLLNQ